MHKSARARLIEIVDFAEAELKDLQAYQNLEHAVYLKDKNSRRLVEKIIENITNAAIDIVKIIISDRGIEMPDSYADIMEKGGNLLELNKNQIKHMVQVAKLRNILAHEYLDLKWDKIKRFLKEYQSTIKLLLDQTGTAISNDVKIEKAE